MTDAGWNWPLATQRLLDTMELPEVARRSAQVERALAAMLTRRPGHQGEPSAALLDQMIILADHFEVPEAYFTDPAVGRRIDSRRHSDAEARRELAASEQELRDALRLTGSKVTCCRGAPYARSPREQTKVNRALTRLVLEPDEDEPDL
jgi:hypothetical protein